MNSSLIFEFIPISSDVPEEKTMTILYP